VRRMPQTSSFFYDTPVSFSSPLKLCVLSKHAVFVVGGPSFSRSLKRERDQTQNSGGFLGFKFQVPHKNTDTSACDERSVAKNRRFLSPAAGSTPLQIGTPIPVQPIYHPLVFLGDGQWTGDIMKRHCVYGTGRPDEPPKMRGDEDWL